MQVEILGPVHRRNILVQVSELAQFKQSEYVRQCSKEVGWIGYVDYQYIEEDSLHFFRIEDVALGEQEVTGVTTNFDSQSFANFAQRLIEEEPDTADEKLDKLLYWGHSHVNMGVSPSPTDLETLSSFDDGRLPCFLVAILNKKGEYRYDVAFFRDGLKYTKVPVEFEEEPRWQELRDNVEQEIGDNVKAVFVHAHETISYAPTYGEPITTKKKAKKSAKVDKSTIIESCYKDSRGHFRNGLDNTIILSSYKAERIKRVAKISEADLDEIIKKQISDDGFLNFTPLLSD